MAEAAGDACTLSRCAPAGRPLILTKVANFHDACCGHKDVAGLDVTVNDLRFSSAPVHVVTVSS